MCVRGDEYWAGIFDGEGTIGVYAASGYWSARMAVVGSYRPMIEEAYKHFGVGSFKTQKRQALQKTPMGLVDSKLGKQCWRWSVTHDRVAVGPVATRICAGNDSEFESCFVGTIAVPPDWAVVRRIVHVVKTPVTPAVWLFNTHTR